MIVQELEEYLGSSTSHGEDEFSFCCPFCVTTGRSPDNEEKLWYNSKKRLYICYRCESKGSLEYLLRFLGAPEEDPVDVNAWHERLGKLRRGLTDDEPDSEQQSEPEVLDYTSHLEENGCVPVHAGSRVWFYLQKRRITSDLVSFYQMVEGRGRYRHRVVVPTFDFEGRVSFFVARAIKDMKYMKHGKTLDAPKYLNPKGEGRKRSLFNLVNAVNYDEVLVTEGVFSAIAAGKNAVATFGKLVTETQVQLLQKTCNGKEIVVCLDGDAHAQTINLAARLSALKANVSMMILPFEHDPDSLGSAALKDLFENRIPYSDTAVLRLVTSGAVKLEQKKPVKKSSSPEGDIASLKARLSTW